MSNAPLEAEIVSSKTPTLRELSISCLRWLRHHLLQSILMALIGMAFGWLVNWYFLVMKYEGFYLPSDGRGGFVGTANLITGQGNVMWGSLTWGLATTVGFGVLGYWWSVGTERFLRDLAGLPDRFAGLFRQRGRQAWSAVLWGVAMSMLVSLFISPWLGVVLASACFVSASSLVGRVLSGLALRAWSALMHVLAPTRRLRYDGGDAVILGMLGSSAALALTFLMPASIPGLRALALLAAIVGAVVLNLVPRSATPMILWFAVAAWLGDLLWPLEVWADDGGWIEAGGNFRGWAQSPGSGVVTTYAGAGGAAAGGGAAIGNAIGQVIGQQGSGPIVDPWTGKPLTPWQPGRFGPGENGQEGRPGQVWWGGNWMDPAEVRERIEEALAADRRREAESRQFEEESRRLRDQAQREREQQAQAEAARQQAARDEAARRAAAVNRMSDDLTAQQREAADRIMQGIDWSNPSPEDLDRLRRLTGAVGNLQQGASESEGAAADADAANAQLGEDAARVVREVGQAAGETAEQILTGGTTRGAITNFIYGAAGAAGEGKGPGEAVANGLRDARDGVIMNVGFGALGRAGVPMPSGPLGQTLLGGAMAAGSAASQGANGEEIIKEGLYGGLGAAAGAGFENNAPGVHLPDAPDTGSPARPTTERRPGPADEGPTGRGDDGTKPPDTTPDRQRELEEALRLKAQDDLRRQRELEDQTRRQNEAEAERKRQEEAEAERKRQEEAEAERRRQEEAEAERKRQEEAEAERKRQEEAEAERRRQEEAEAERKRQQEAEAQRKRQEEAEADRRRQEEAETERKRQQEAEAQRKRQEETEAERKRREESEAERKRQEEAEAERRRQEDAEAERKRQQEERKRQEEAEAERKRQEEAKAEQKRQEEAKAEQKRQEEAKAEQKRQEEAKAEQKRQEEAKAEQKRQEEAKAEQKRQEEAKAEQKRQEEAKAEQKRQEEAKAEQKRQEKADAESKRQQEAEAKRQEELSKKDAEEARQRREKQTEVQRRQQEQQREQQELQEKEQKNKQAQQQQQAIDMRTERLRQVNDYLNKNPQERKHNYINMDTTRLADAMNKGALTPGLEPLVHATWSGAGAAGYVFESTQVVRIPQENTVVALRVKDGVFYDSKNRPIDSKLIADKIVTIPNAEGTGVNPFHVGADGKPSTSIPTRFLERWNPATQSFVPV